MILLIFVLIIMNYLNLHLNKDFVIMSDEEERK
jgi:hypothetical protein